MKENQTPPTYSSLKFFIFLSLQCSDIKKSSRGPTKLRLGPHMNSRFMYYMYLNQTAGAYLFLCFFNFLSLKFKNIKCFVTLFSLSPTKLKLDMVMG